MTKRPPIIDCPGCETSLNLRAEGLTTCAVCGYQASTDGAYVDLMVGHASETSEHYSKQWSSKTGFLDFLQKNPTAKKVMPAARLGWDELFARIRGEAKTRDISVYDAACGFGGLANELVKEDTWEHLTYVGADIHRELRTIVDSIPYFDRCGTLLHWDIARPLPLQQRFDYVLCRASIHHTPDPLATFSALCKSLKAGGTIAISVYNKKAICREACDDALRNTIAPMNNQDALAASRQLAILGRALQGITQTLSIPEDLPLLGIRKGQSSVQELIYYNVLKCFYNEEYGEEYSTLVNFDWYHPPYAYRFSIDEVRAWFDQNAIDVVETVTIEVQHYLVGRKRSV